MYIWVKISLRHTDGVLSWIKFCMRALCEKVNPEMIYNLDYTYSCSQWSCNNFEIKAHHFKFTKHVSDNQHPSWVTKLIQVNC